jgi:hypothetical protein
MSMPLVFIANGHKQINGGIEILLSQWGQACMRPKLFFFFVWGVWVKCIGEGGSSWIFGGLSPPPPCSQCVLIMFLKCSLRCSIWFAKSCSLSLIVSNLCAVGPSVWSDYQTIFPFEKHFFSNLMEFPMIKVIPNSISPST